MLNRSIHLIAPLETIPISNPGKTRALWYQAQRLVQFLVSNLDWPTLTRSVVQETINSDTNKGKNEYVAFCHMLVHMWSRIRC